MHVFRKSKENQGGQRLHSSPSLPNIWLPRSTAPSEHSSEAKSPTSHRTHLGPLDLAPSKLGPPPSPPSPRRPPLPLTPPLTPASSLSGGLSEPGNPATPTDNDSAAPSAAGWPRYAKRVARQPVYRDDDVHAREYDQDDEEAAHMRNRGQRQPYDDTDDDADRTPTEHPYEARCREQDSQHHAVRRYLDRDPPASRFLLIGNVPRHLTHDAIKQAFGAYGDSKGIHAGHLQRLGIVILAFYNLRHSETARRAINAREALIVQGDVQLAVQMRANFVCLAEAKELTGNPSPVTEIETDAAFYIQIKDRAMLPGRVQELLLSFGQLLAFRECTWIDMEGQWFYVEYYDVRETQAAYRDLHDKPLVLDAQFALYPAGAVAQHLPAPMAPQHAHYEPPRPSQSRRQSADTGVPFPSAGSPTTAEFMISPRAARPRSASAEAGDGVKAFADLSFALEDRLRRRLAPRDQGAERDGEGDARQRSLSFDAARRAAEDVRASEYAEAYGGEFVSGGYEADSSSAVYESGAGGGYDRAGPDYFIPTAASVYVAGPQYVLPRQTLAHPPRRPREHHHDHSHVHAHAHAHAPTPHAPRAAHYNTPLAIEPAPEPPYVAHPASAAGPTPEHNQLNLARISSGADTRTTVMIKNIPNKMSDRDLMSFIERIVRRRVDFFYLRMDFQNGCNVGYAFVNFITVKDLLVFAKAKLGVKWNMYSSEKVLQMSYANYQGKEALVEKFKNSGIMDEREAWRPKIFFSDGPQQGLPEPFPAPTHQRRKERSAHNRGALFVPGVAR